MPGLWSDGGGRNLVHLAVKGKALGSVGGPDGIDDVVEVGVRLLDGNAEGGVLMGGHSSPDAEMQPASAEEDVEHRDLAG